MVVQTLSHAARFLLRRPLPLMVQGICDRYVRDRAAAAADETDLGRQGAAASSRAAAAASSRLLQRNDVAAIARASFVLAAQAFTAATSEHS